MKLAILVSLAGLFSVVPTHAQKAGTTAVDSILGVRVGMTPHEADEALEKVGDRPAGEAGEMEDGEAKEAWAIRGTDYRTVVIKRGKSGLITWVSGFVRPGREVSFGSFGDLKTASRASSNSAVWDVRNASGGYKLVVKGRNGKAAVVYILSLASPSVD